MGCRAFCRYLLILWVCVNSLLGVQTRYVNTASTAGGDCTTNGTAGATRACATLSEAEALLTGTLSEPWIIKCVGSAADTTPVVVAGFTGSATNYVLIEVEQANRHSGVWNTGKYRLEVANSIALSMQTSWVRVDGLQIAKSAVSANGQNGIEIATGIGAGSDIRLSNLIIKHASAGTFRQCGIRIADVDAVVSIWNLIDYDHPGNLSEAYDSSVVVDTATTVSVYSSTLIGGFHGLRRVAGTVVSKNNYASKTHASGSSYNGTITLTTSASSDTTGDTGLQSIALNTTNFTNVTGGSQDFHLPSGSALVNVGTDTSGDAAPLNFTVDIDAETRSGTWDIGADERAAATRRRVVIVR